MKTRFLKSAAALMLSFVLLFSLTGCDSLDYREAVQLYNAGSYEEAAEIFAQLGDYEDSARLETRCYYWIAIKAMEYGRYDSALEQFEALGDYEDSAERSIECRYQLGIESFDSGDLDTAETYFLETPGYKQTAEYLRRVNWQRFHNAVAEKGTESGASFTLQQELDGRVFGITADMGEPNQLIFSVSNTKDMGYVFYDDLTLILTRDSTSAVFTADSTFTMDFKGGQIGSEQAGSGTVDIAACTPETVLILDNFAITATDNLGKTTSSTDPADSLMAEDMAENLAALLQALPQLLTESGIELTLADIGFAAIQ